MKDLKGTKTEKNLMDAFAGESQAHTKYLYYASKAKKEGYVQISNLFIDCHTEDNIDIIHDCTMCLHDKYWSHRYTGGVRGSLASVIMKP